MLHNDVTLTSYCYKDAMRLLVDFKKIIETATSVFFFDILFYWPLLARMSLFRIEKIK